MGRRLGQHFLRDERVLDAVLDAAHIEPAHTVLEIGPGPGNLTERLAKAVPSGRVVAIEADPLLAAGLKGRWPNVDIVVGDAVQVDLSKPVGAPLRFDRIVANLPYLISGPITAAFLDLFPQPGWGRAVLMYQAEFAERLLAGPGTGDYGRLSVHAARRVKVTKVCDVAPGAFDPPPKVDSMVVRLEPFASAPFEVGDEAVWRAVVDGPFQQRRKKMRNTLPAAVAGLGIRAEWALAALQAIDAPNQRPEELEPKEFAHLSRVLSAHRAREGL